MYAKITMTDTYTIMQAAAHQTTMIHNNESTFYVCMYMCAYSRLHIHCNTLIYTFHEDITHTYNTLRKHVHT